MNSQFSIKMKAFTLIELLVVIAIISLLMSILLPALGAVKAQSKGAVCKANLRQLIIANIGYATENRDSFVAAASDLWDTSGGLQRWHGVRENPDEAFDPLKGPLVSYLEGGGSKECPANLISHEGRSWNESFEKGCGGYGYNMAYLGSTLWRYGIMTIDEWKQCYAKTTKITQVLRSGETLMFADSAYPQDDQLIEYSFAEARYWLLDGEPELNAKPIPSIHFRHNLKTNVGWVDGHVSSIDMPKHYDGVHAYLETYRSMLLGMIEPLDNSSYDLK
ncbi:MAG: prepilin-type N-terminal cleavage/methylation domain-containing protein [Sedimentisphaerales bacterium]|nr:prepilin-type N-terminal cleavage/methylation domain-containing protein [Sedimentisphaerales bacterium]